ncbi:HAD-IB family hydrolase [Ruania alba]|uniref:HAD-superfamily subfamily IB hydrolase, TIGR01490 n=1 Tax=Ruania alba TaxID=648782 RepID=A0A1H5LWL5_9MICO|nr:HAD-IB family hydrolase [Ruania alba]SEE80791.1 HAD-superfamily subfamily IB hydrolase, TIGR01490 [Ruania alba]
MSDPLKNAHVLVTGATGFVGQAVVEKLLAAYPTTRIALLVRPRGALTAQDRVTKLLKKPVFGPWRESLGAEAADAEAARRITVIPGDLGDVPPLPKDLTHVVHSASTVSFDLPIDEAFAANVGGPVSLYEALEATGADPHVVHVSTCYVAGLRKGLAEERSLDHSVDREVEMTRALRARESAEAASRRPQVLDKILAKARATHRRAGAQAVSQAAEEARKAWVNTQLVNAGRTRATSVGWPDVYTFTKALGERVAEDLWAGGGHRLSIVRPTIIESSLQHPFPGWIDGFKVADPLIAAYGRGMLPEFPALADSVLDVIPVDHVVNAILAAAASPPEPKDAAYYQVASGSRNPLRFGTILRLLRGYFQEHPLTDDDGSFVQVPNWTFPNGPAVQRSLRRREVAVDVADSLVGRLPANDTTRGWISSVYKAKRNLGTLRKFTDLYQAYTQTEVVFDDTNTHALHEALPAERRDEHGFDVTAIDWTYYMQEVHVPKVPGLMRARRPKSTPSTSAKSLPQREDVLAVFDLHGTVAAASLIEHYVWVELAAKGVVPALKGLGGMVASSGTYLQAEWRDRGDFIRSFMRRYAGVDEAELREIIATKVTPSLRARLLAEATERIALHRAAGHRTVLVSGQIDVFVEPLADMFDVIVAGEMEKDSAGKWTGHLAASPLVDEARASWLRRYAREEGMDLAGSYAYGDTYADRPWLEVVGQANVVNPDASLYRFAREKRWPVHTWTTTAEGRLSPVVRSVTGGRR